MTMSEPWFEVVDSGVDLTQGDMILNCPLLKWQLDQVAPGNAASEAAEVGRLLAAVRAVRADVIVMTQACDLAHHARSSSFFASNRKRPRCSSVLTSRTEDAAYEDSRRCVLHSFGVRVSIATATFSG
jgi:hypothetical protein